MTKSLNYYLLLSGLIFILSLVFVHYASYFFGEPVGSMYTDGGYVMPEWFHYVDPIVKVLGVLGSAFAFITMSILAWRKDRRETIELKQRLLKSSSKRYYEIGHSLLPSEHLLYKKRIIFFIGLFVFLQSYVNYAHFWFGEISIISVDVIKQEVLILPEWAINAKTIFRDFMIPLCLIMASVFIALSWKNERTKLYISQQLVAHRENIVVALSRELGIDYQSAAILFCHGFDSAKLVRCIDRKELLAISGIGKKTVDRIHRHCRKNV